MQKLGGGRVSELHLVLLFWAVMLALTRVWLASDAAIVADHSPLPSSKEEALLAGTEFNSLGELAAWIHKEILAVDLNLQTLAKMTFLLDVDTASLEQEVRLVEQKVRAGDGDKELPPSVAQEVVPAAEFLTPTASGIPGLLPPEAFCDQLENTIPGDLPRRSRLTKLCRQLPVGGGPIADKRFDSVGDQIDATVLYVLRALHARMQLSDRIQRFTERLGPKIRAMEKRTDRMLYNYI
jgi:hypothetical protein